jgi:predicted CopG family antitoxin
MKEGDKIVAIKVKLSTRERLKASKRGGESYEDVITKMFGELGGDAGDKRQ